MLVLNPGLTAGEVQAILQDTTASDGFTGATPNSDRGYGKLDIPAALETITAAI